MIQELSEKDIQNEIKLQIIKNKKIKMYSCICGKIYKSRSGLWKHKKNKIVEDYSIK